ncbi:nucleotide-binding oligomerization domain-containing protein 2-like [Acropora millepora]|uniref:nucleotide-binding oligomerization domain-containing protein 2-like n=1 Tax=Acropora millepora TaxID=45264 RepID=UPI001CF180D1|nr:nucleotide-binding oligomerization domain-containing protein 2-like [Acropora millepora]
MIKQNLRERRRIDDKMEFSAIIEKIRHKTLNKFAFAVVTLFWILFHGILIGAFSDMEYNEPRSDFRCDVTAEDKVNADFIRSECYNHYLKQNHKLLIPPLLFVLVNMSLVPIVTAIYSFYANSTVKALKRSHQDAKKKIKDRGRNLFFAYLWQLIINIIFEITFIILLETQLLYPRNFPSHFSCSSSVNGTQSTTSFNCSNHRAASKSIWIRVVTAANGIFALFAFLEIIWILSRCRHGKEFMENWRFYADHLNSNSDEQRQGQPDGIPLVESQDAAVNISHEQRNDEITNPSELQEHSKTQNDFHSAIKTLKENCLQGTEKLSDLKQPFGQPNHGEGDIHDLTIDKVYVHVVIVEGRAFHKFAEESRSEQLQEYPPDAKDCKFAKPGDILDENHKNVLVVGRPGIGKTSFSTKLLRLWASGEAFKHFNVVFLLKFRRFNNDNANLSLRDLIAHSETVRSLDDAVWDFINQEPTKVLLIFDGLDEYSRKKDIETQEDDLTYKNCVEEKMPVSVLYNKLAKGKLFPGASLITTTRPTAVKCVRHVRFQRTVEIRGFTSDDVKEYVENFSRGYPQAMEKMWEHIKSNINLFSFCYIPMNCFLICHCLLQIILSESAQALPTKMTDIYKITVKMFLLSHNREGFSPEELARLKSTHMDEPFDKLPEELQKVFRSLGKIAFKGIEEGRLLFESSEVSGLEDCGLLHKLPDLKRKALDAPSKSQFCFTHLTVQEFFAAKHLVDTMTDEGIEEFVCYHINDGTWQVVLQFAAGLLKSSLSSHIFIKLLPESTKKEKNPSSSEPKTLTSWPAREDKHLAVQVCKCLYEINDEQQQPVLQNKIEKIKFNAVDFSRCSLAPIDVAAVLHFLENAEEVLHINLYYNSLGDLGANEVKKFIVHRGRKLQSLDLSRNNFTDSAAKDFAAALKHSNCKLESLDLILINNFTAEGRQYLTDAGKQSNCKVILSRV